MACLYSHIFSEHLNIETNKMKKLIVKGFNNGTYITLRITGFPDFVNHLHFQKK
jgi:hypothetical protein